MIDLTIFGTLAFDIKGSLRNLIPLAERGKREREREKILILKDFLTSRLK